MILLLLLLLLLVLAVVVVAVVVVVVLLHLKKILKSKKILNFKGKQNKIYISTRSQRNGISQVGLPGVLSI